MPTPIFNVETRIRALKAILADTGEQNIVEKSITDAGGRYSRAVRLRKRLLFDVYVASLYLPAKVSAAAAVLAAEPRRVEIHMLRKVGADDFLEAIKNGIEANTSQTERDAIRPQMSELAKVMTAIGETREGDTITLDFVGGSTLVTFNGIEKTRIAGEGFNRALLNAWLGDRPVQADLKKAMLGG